MKIDDLMLLLTYKKAGFDSIKKGYYKTLVDADEQIGKEENSTILRIGGRLVMLSHTFSVLNKDFEKAELNDFMVAELFNIIQDLKKVRNND